MFIKYEAQLSRTNRATLCVNVTQKPQNVAKLSLYKCTHCLVDVYAAYRHSLRSMLPLYT